LSPKSAQQYLTDQLKGSSSAWELILLIGEL
jgi:hypothetical protein